MQDGARKQTSGWEECSDLNVGVDWLIDNDDGDNHDNDGDHEIDDDIDDGDNDDDNEDDTDDSDDDNDDDDVAKVHASNRLSATSAATPMLRVAAAFVSPRAAQKEKCNSQNLPTMTMAKMMMTRVVMRMTRVVMKMVIIPIMTMVVMERLRWT